MKVSNSRVIFTMLIGAFVLLMSLPGKTSESNETASSVEGSLYASNDGDAVVEDEEASTEVVPAPAYIAPENEDSPSEDETFVEE